MGAGQSTDDKLDNVNKKLDTMQHTIGSLPRTAGCDLSSVNQRLDTMQHTIGSLPRTAGCDLSDVNQRLDTMQHTIDSLSGTITQLDTVDQKLDTMQHTIDSLPRTATCDLSSVNQNLSDMQQTINANALPGATCDLSSVNQKLDTMGPTIDSLSGMTECDLSSVNQSLSDMQQTINADALPGATCDLSSVNQKLDTMRDNMITGVDGLNENIINSYYFISQQNSNLAEGLHHSLVARDEVEDLARVAAGLHALQYYGNAQLLADAPTGPKKLSGLRSCDPVDQLAVPSVIDGSPCSWT